MEGTTDKPVVEPIDHKEALETIKAIEMMGYALDDKEFKLKFSDGIFRCMTILRTIHDDLVSKLPPGVIAAERAKNLPPQGPPKDVQNA